ncbi:MAG TPA: glycosyltransferase, partial [Gemmatimonadaceae bacterium]|nr:glycosyltransferase [Gemmatimonadaceae bacterium]
PQDGVEARDGEIVFTGSMDWMPNEEGIAWFVRDILPRIRREVPGAHLSIVGRNPTALVRSLGSEAVEVTGTVPDIRPYLQRASAVVVPLRVGGGTRLKIFEAMAMECAIVSTTIGAEGLPVGDGEHLRIADTPEGFASAVVSILRDRAAARRLGEASAALVRQRFGWASVTDDFIAACEATVARWREGAARRTPPGRAA